jgi:surface protein
LKKIIKDCQNLFSENDYIINVDLTSFNARNVTTMEKMFYKCKNLKSVNLSNLNAEKLTDISEMFYECNNLTNVNLSSFNIINATDMKYMFSHSGLKKINLNFINTHNLKNITGLFSY